MDKHALALLSNNTLWEEVGLTKWEVYHPGLVTSLLFHLVSESQALGGCFSDEFWLNLGKCNSKLQENISKLRAAPELVSEKDVSAMLFNGVLDENFTLSPIFMLAGEYFTHLGLSFMQPRDTLGVIDADRSDDNCGSGEDSDPNEADETEMFKTKLDVQEKGLSDDQILKYSAFNRDGFSCVITGFPLEYPLRPYRGRFSLIDQLNIDRFVACLTTIIPILIKESPSALKCITVLAGGNTRQLLLTQLSTVNNVMVLAYNARSKFDNLVWAIEALDSGKYIYRRVPTVPGPGPLSIKLQDGSEIKFGRGQDGVGPLPQFCKLRLAVARALRLSGAARLMGRLIEDTTIDTSRVFSQDAPSNYYLQLALSL